MITIQPIYSKREFLSLESIWNKLLGRSDININRVFYTFEFMRLWWDYFSSSYELLILLAKEGDEPIGIFPLVKRQNGKLVEIRLLGDSNVDYQDFIITRQREECIESVLNFLSEEVSSWDMLSLDNLPFDSPNFLFFEKQARLKGKWVRLEEFGRAPYIKINTDWDAFYRNIDKKMRNDTQRQLRRLYQQGELHFEQCQSIEEIPFLMNKMFKYKNRRYRDTGKKGLYMEKKMMDFHLSLAQIFWEKGWLDISYTQLNGDIIAIHFGSIYQDKFYYWMPAFNSEYEKYSSSRILLLSLVERAFKNRLCEFDFGFGGEPYKYQWTQQARHLYRFLYFNQTIKGLLLREWFYSWRGFVRKNIKLNNIFKSIEKIVTER